MKRQFFLFSCFLLVIVFPLHAHTINYALENAPLKDVSQFYFILGFRHIIPEGLDHVLFIIGICLINSNIKQLVWQASAFTLAHTVALILSMKNIIEVPPAIIEPIIAASIIFIAVENLLLQKIRPHRLLLIFLFGLIHGMGFASSLNETGLPPDAFFSSILLFNIGIEVCQLLIICLLYALFIKPFYTRTWYKYRIVYPLSICIAIISSYWMVERLME